MGEPELTSKLLRQRSRKRDKSPKQRNSDKQAKHEVVWGKTPEGIGKWHILVSRGDKFS